MAVESPMSRAGDDALCCAIDTANASAVPA